MRKPRRSAVKTPRRTPAPARRPIAKKVSPPELTPDEVVHLEELSQRYERSERAWLSMTAPPGGDETWTQVEEHLLSDRRGAQDQDRRWKYFSK